MIVMDLLLCEVVECQTSNTSATNEANIGRYIIAFVRSQIALVTTALYTSKITSGDSFPVYAPQ